MDGDRKYKQSGYMDNDRDRSNSNGRDDRPRQQGPRQPIDITGPRLPRLVQSIVASRCYNCSTTLPGGMDFKGACPKCNVSLHCCKQCAHFESSTRFQCLKPIPERIPSKDKANECAMFDARVTVARDASPSGPQQPSATLSNTVAPRNPSDARAMFDNLFKK